MWLTYTAVALSVAGVAACVLLAWQLIRQARSTGSLYDLLVEVTRQVLARPDRVMAVEMALTVSKRPEVRRQLLDIVGAVSPAWPGCQVDINLLGPEDDTRLVADPAEGILIDPVVPCEDSYCAFTIAAGRLVEVPDSLDEPSLAGSPYLRQVRSYLGYPLCVAGQHVGVCCVYHPDPRAEWTEEDRRRVVEFAEAVAAVFDDALAPRGT